MNITGSTCDFGLAQVGGECSRSFSSFSENDYLRTQIVYLSVGFLSVTAASLLYWRAVRRDANKLQQRSLLFCVYASLTFILRSADPDSYRHAIPHPVICYLSDSCTAALYSIFILSLSYWASVIQSGAAHIQRPLDLRYVEWTAIAVLWSFYLVLDMLLFATKGFFKPLMTYLQLLLSAGVLALIGVAFFLYGARVRSRLLYFERQRVLFELRNNAYEPIESSRSGFDPNESRLEPGDTLRKRPLQGAGTSHGNRILKIVTVVEVLVVLVIAAQVYISVSESSGSVELDCANGVDCSEVKSSVSLLHWFQLAGIWVVLWVFHKAEQPEEKPAESD